MMDSDLSNSQSCPSAHSVDTCKNTRNSSLTLNDGRVCNGQTMEDTSSSEVMNEEISVGFNAVSQPHDGQLQGTWMEESVKIRQNVVGMLKYMGCQFQNYIPELSQEQTEVSMEEDSDDDIPMDVAGTGLLQQNEDEEILPDRIESWQQDSSSANEKQYSVVKVEAASPVFDDEPDVKPEGIFCGEMSSVDGQQIGGAEVKLETGNQEECVHFGVEDTMTVKKEEVVMSGLLGDNIFTSIDDNVPPCVSQEEVVADCADTDPQEVEVPLSYSETFNNFKDAKVTVEMNEEEVDILGAASPAVKNHNYDEDSESSQESMGDHKQPLQHAMYHAMVPLPHHSRVNPLPYNEQTMSNGYGRGGKRDYSHDVPVSGPIRTKAARKITPPIPIKKEIVLDSPDGSCPSKSLEDNLRKQELDETFFTCDFCFKLFRRRNALMAHIKLHEALNIGNHSGNIFECKQCQKTYSSRYNLIHHMKRCHGDKEYKCVTCNVAYATQSDLTRHARTHAGKSYKCNRCGKEFQKRKSFAAHTRVHRQVMYECGNCIQKFSWAEELVEHNKIHQAQNGTPVTVLTSTSNSNTAASAQTEPDVDDSKDHRKQAAHLKLDYCYAYIKRVKAQFASQPHVYQDFLNTIKQFKFKSIDINHFLDRISNLFRDHPSLIHGFNIFLPDECKVDVPMSPKSEALAVHDPLLDQQLNPRGELDDSLAYLGLVKARFADRPNIYNTFTFIIKEYKLNSLQIPEVAARVTALFKDHPDLIKGFNTFLPLNNRIDVSLYDSQSNQSHDTIALDKTSQTTLEPTLRASNSEQDVPYLTPVQSEDNVSLTNAHNPQEIPLANGHTTASISSNRVISPTFCANTCAETPAVGNITSPPGTKNSTTHNEAHPTQTEIKQNIKLVSNHKSMISVDNTLVYENGVAQNESSVEGNNINQGYGKPELKDSKQHENASISRCRRTSMSANSDDLARTDKASHVRKNTPDKEDTRVSAEAGGISEKIFNSEKSVLLTPNKQELAATLFTSNLVQSGDSEESSSANVVCVPQTYTNVITVSPSSSDVSSSIESTVIFNNSTLPKVSVGSSIMSSKSMQPTTPSKYTGKNATSPSLVSTATQKTSSLLESTCTKKLSPTKIVPLKNNSLLYQQLMTKNNCRKPKNTSIATFTKIEDNKKEYVETLDSETNCSGSEVSSLKADTISHNSSLPFKTGSKLSIPYVLNSPNSNVIFTLANTMANNNNTKVHGLANNNLAVSTHALTTGTITTTTTTKNSDTVSDCNNRAVYAIPVNGARTSCTNLALINANALQSIANTNLYTGINIVTSTNSTSNTCTVASNKSTAPLQTAVVSAGNGATKQMLLIRTNPTSNTFLISNTSNQVLPNGSSVQSGCLLPVQQAIPGVNCVQISNDIKSSNSNKNNMTTCTLSNKLIALAGSKLTANNNNNNNSNNNARVKTTNFLAGQKIAIVKTPISNRPAKRTSAISLPNIVSVNSTTSGNIVNTAGGTRLLTNASLNSSSPKKRKVVTNRSVDATNVNNIQKKIDPIVRNYLSKNRPLLPVSINKGQTPLVISFVSRKSEVCIGREKRTSESEDAACTSSDVQQCASLTARTVNDQTQGIVSTVGFQIKTKAGRKQCAVKTVPAVDSTFSESLHNGTILANETCPKTYSRQDSLVKAASECRPEGTTEPGCPLKEADSG